MNKNLKNPLCAERRIVEYLHSIAPNRFLCGLQKKKKTNLVSLGT